MQRQPLIMVVTMIGILVGCASTGPLGPTAASPSPSTSPLPATGAAPSATPAATPAPAVTQPPGTSKLPDVPLSLSGDGVDSKGFVLHVQAGTYTFTCKATTPFPLIASYAEPANGDERSYGHLRGSTSKPLFDLSATTTAEKKVTFAKEGAASFVMPSGIGHWTVDVVDANAGTPQALPSPKPLYVDPYLLDGDFSNLAPPAPGSPVPSPRPSVAAPSTTPAPVTALGINFSAYLTLYVGESYDSVAVTLGSPGHLQASSSGGGLTISIYTWSEGFKVISCGFQNDKLTNKNEVGL